VTYSIRAITSSQATDFSLAYEALAAEFGHRGELEPRRVIERWTDQNGSQPAGRGLLRRYFLLAAYDHRGEFAGVRDGHVVVDPSKRIAVIYLAHVLVLPAFRRTGLSGLFRRTPLPIAHSVMDAAGTDRGASEILFAAEMEFSAPTDEASYVRFASYGGDGFAALDPAVLAYFQPAFGALPGARDERPIPLLAVVRRLGHEGATTLPKRLAVAFVEHLYAVFADHLDPTMLRAMSGRMLAGVHRYGADGVPLLPLPRTREAVAAWPSALVVAHRGKP
jgi:hypothetical protein